MTNRDKLNGFLKRCTQSFTEISNKDLVDFLQTFKFCIKTHLSTYLPYNGYRGSLDDAASLINWLNEDADKRTPCSVCGNEEIEVLKHWSVDGYFAACPECGSSSDIYATRDEAIAAWNRGERERDYYDEYKEMMRNA